MGEKATSTVQVDRGPSAEGAHQQMAYQHDVRVEEGIGPGGAEQLEPWDAVCFATGPEGASRAASGLADLALAQGRKCFYTTPIKALSNQKFGDLRQRYGEEISRWQWGEPHAAHMQHRPFSRVAPLARLFDIRVPTPGDAFTVNVGRSDLANEAAPFASRHAASLRALYDLADPQASLFIHPGGQSGNPFSAHYRSFAGAWARGEYVPMVTDRARLESQGVQRLVLTPRK